MHYLYTDSPTGTLLLAVSAQGLSGVYFPEHRHFKGIAGWQAAPEHPLLLAAAEQLAAYFSGQRQHFDLPLDLSAGTVFQQAVWRQLARIPYGQPLSYGQLAQQLGNPAAVRAVGAANGKNPLSIILPCHRVIAANGALTGYAGGLKNKQYLLNFEANMRQLKPSIFSGFQA